MRRPRIFVSLASLLVLAVGFAASGCDSAADEQPNVETLTIEGAQFEADPVKTGANTLIFSVTIKSDAGAPITGAVVTVDPQMPMHGHGSTEEPVVTDNGDGTYTATNVVFQMPGAWEVTISATRDSDTGSHVMQVTVQ